MTHILKYKPEHEEELLALLANEPDWSTFLGEGTIDRFKKALREGETYLYLSQGKRLRISASRKDQTSAPESGRLCVF